MAEIIGYLSISGAIKLLWTYANSEKRPPIAQHVGEVKELHLFPIKSMGGIPLKTAECTQRGLKYPSEEVFDRNFMVIDKNDIFVTARAIPKMATIKVSLSGDTILIQCTDMPDLHLPARPNVESALVANTKVWREHVQGHYCGNEANEWVSKCLDIPESRLIYCSDGLLWRQLNKQTDKWKLPAKDGDKVTFQDHFPFLLTNEASMHDLNIRKKGDPFRINRFRPNIVITGPAAWDEDNWDEVWIGDIKFTNLKPCLRCSFPTIDPEVGVKDKDGEPLATLLSFRLDEPKFGSKAMFGINLVLDSQDNSSIRVGDPVYVLRKKSSYF